MTPTWSIFSMHQAPFQDSAYGMSRDFQGRGAAAFFKSLPTSQPAQPGRCQRPHSSGQPRAPIRKSPVSGLGYQLAEIEKIFAAECQRDFHCKLMAAGSQVLTVALP